MKYDQLGGIVQQINDYLKHPYFQKIKSNYSRFGSQNTV